MYHPSVSDGYDPPPEFRDKKAKAVGFKSKFASCKNIVSEEKIDVDISWCINQRLSNFDSIFIILLAEKQRRINFDE